MMELERFGKQRQFSDVNGSPTRDLRHVAQRLNHLWLTFSQRWLQSVSYSGIQHHVVRYKLTGVSEEYDAYIFGAEE
jgi:hypothetical protein